MKLVVVKYLIKHGADIVEHEDKISLINDCNNEYKFIDKYFIKNGVDIKYKRIILLKIFRVDTYHENYDDGMNIKTMKKTIIEYSKNNDNDNENDNMNI
ncbi:hypothetical protein BCR32DRAFT_275796 [Anaeromyces robustus]|uniref:Ankyrin n=1 Tax=Anaeromyces robustus TaxID=1754192 RepID=A0A1Y1XJQ7_9FUNG|nr:hypothetical protein BCR32DRAFT_275796 [Anaeromyces robustus]|eukprot:ORX85978.1 hypothetical protein BCR32DRAFT_275796 [Anaeromyces robustus]